MDPITIGDVAYFVIEKGCGFLMEKGLGKFAPNPVDKAYDRALEKWCRNNEIRKHYAVFKHSHFDAFRDYLQKGPEVCDTEVLSLCKLFEEELKETPVAYQFIQDIYNKNNKQRLEQIQQTIGEIQNSIIQLDENNTAQHIEQNQILNRILTSIESPRKLEATSAEAYKYDKESYIKRKCCLALEERNYLDKYLHSENYPEGDLVDFVFGKFNVGSNKLILCGDAQSGKTTELKHLFHELVESGLFRLCYNEVKGWNNDLPSLSEAEQRESLLIIDALDEKFNDNERNELFNSICNYANSHPLLRMVVSCRSNFKEIDQLENFVHLELMDFSWEESKLIISEKCNNPKGLVDEIESRGLYELVRIPLFLLTLIECYQENNEIPNNRPQIYEYLIDKRLRCEEEKSLTPHPRMLTHGKTALISLAVGLQLMDRNSMTEDEMLDLFNDELQWDRLLRSGIIDKQGNKYEFSHNSFKEFFVAGFLKRLNKLDEIQQLCCFQGVKVIKPTWYNVFVSYLADLSPQNLLFSKLIDWLEKDNKELLCYVEPQVVGEEKRCNLFIGIIEDCKKKGIIYGVRNHGLPEALMKFGFGQKVLDYIISELQNTVSYDTHLSNLLTCLQYLNWNLLNIENNQRANQLQELLYDLFARFVNDDKAWAIWEPFENPYLFGKDTLDNLLSNIINSKHPRIWDSFIRLVYKANLANYYIDIIIEKSEFVHDYDDNGVTCAILPIWVNESFKSVTTSEGILKILSYFERGVRDRASRNEFVVNHKGVIEVLISNGERVIPKTELTTVLIKVFESGIDPISSYGETHDINKPIVDYLTRQGLAESLFEEYTEKIVSGFENKVQDLSPHKYSKCAAYFVSGERFELFASQYPNTEVGFLSVRCLNSYISNRDYNYTQIIKEYYPLYYADVDTQIRNQKTYYLNCLFDYESFKNEVMRLLYEYPDNRQALRKRLDEYDDIEDRLNIYVYYFFNVFIQKDGYDFEAIEKNINDKDFYQMFLLKETVNMLSTENDKILTDAQVQVLVQIAKEFIHRFANEDERLTIHHLYHPIEMILRGYVDIDDSCLLKLLPYSTYYIYDSNRMNYYSLFEYISGRPGIDKQVIMDYIVSEVKSGRSITEFEHIKWAGFIIHNNIENGFHYVIDWAKNDEYDSILPMLADNPRTLQIVTSENVYNQFPLRVRLSLFEILVRKEGYDASWVKYQLELLFDSLDEETDRFSAMRMLLMLGSIKGLEYLNMHPEYFSKKRLIMDYDCVESLPLLFDSLDWLMEERDGYEGVVLYETKTSVFTSIGKIAAQSQSLFETIEQRINELVETNKEKYSELNYHLSDWKENLYKKYTQIWTIERVREVLLEYKLVR